MRTLLRRLAADRLVLATTALTVLVGMVQLASAPIYSDAVTRGALRRILADVPLSTSAIVVDVRTEPDDYTSTSAVVDSAIDQATALIGAEVASRIEATRPFEAPRQLSEDKVDLIAIRHLTDIESHASLVAGSWPSGRSDQRSAGWAMTAAVEAGVADSFGLDLGQTVQLIDRSDPDANVLVELVGLYTVDDVTDPFWAGDELLQNGVEEGTSFRTFGPLIVSRQALLDDSAGRLRATWSAEPNLDRLKIGELSQLAANVERLPDRLTADFSAAEGTALSNNSDPEVETALVAVLNETNQSLSVTRSGVLAIVVQLALLSALAIVVTAHLMVESRRTQTGLFEARGAGGGHLLALSLVEAAVIVVPLAVAAPWIATWLIGILNRVGPLASVGLLIEPQVSIRSYVVVAVTAVAMVGLLAWPTIRAMLPTRAPRAKTSGRQGAKTLVQGVGLDVALAALTIVAFWQLRNLGPQRGTVVGRNLSIDPALVITPTLALLTGAIASIRLIPVLARLAERKLNRGPIGHRRLGQLADCPTTNGAIPGRVSSGHGYEHRLFRLGLCRHLGPIAARPSRVPSRCRRSA